MNRRSFLRSLGLIAGTIAIAPASLLRPVDKPVSNVELVKRLLQNSIEAHDNLIEAAIFRSVPTCARPATSVPIILSLGCA